MPIRPANIQWSGAQPTARDFDDIYFSDDGIAETQRVFIQPSGILERSQQQPAVCVAELGFGTGLNFAILAQALLTQPTARLHFISFEKFPLARSDWDKVLHQRRQALPIYEELVRQAPPLLPGWHQRVFAGGRITLQVYHGDVADGVADLAVRQVNPVDAWFLDGFAPSKNPAMWSAPLYAHIASLAHAATTVTTFTAAGHVRRGLQNVGFDMRKVDQQPFKRESLAGVYQGEATRTAYSPLPRATIHGAGMAGAFTARHLAEAGVSVQVFDPHGIAQGASSMAATVLHSRLLGDGSAHADLRSSAFHYASTYLQRFDGFAATGVMWVQGPNLDAPKLQRISDAYQARDANQHGWIRHLSGTDASDLCAAKVSADALYHPSGGVVDAPALCAELLDHAAIEVIPAAGPLDATAPNIVCAATATRRFPGCEWLEITDVYGQLDWYDCEQPVTRMPVVGNGYLVPTVRGCVLGASYEHKPWQEEEATAHNLQLNQHLLGAARLSWSGRRRGARCVSSDRTPVVGQLHGDAHQDALWLHTGLGSMGTTAGVLGAAALSATLLGWLPPLAPDVMHLLRPERFKERQARRGVRHIEPLPPQ